jgi:hypothetical protein
MGRPQERVIIFVVVLHQLAAAMVNNHYTRWKLHTETVGAKQIKEFVKIHATNYDRAVSAYTFLITQSDCSTHTTKPLQSFKIVGTICPTAQLQ